jgi:DNA replication and repair protein RecF
MYLKNLSVIQFKNYDEADLQFDQEFNCFVGKNGSGKTNVLDAVHYLSLCKSFLNQIDSQNVKWDHPFFVVQGEFVTEDDTHPVYCGVKKGQKKKFRRKGNEYERLADHIGLFPSVMISPYDRNLISEGSEIRRKFIDSIIAQLNKPYLEKLMRYNKVLAQRNAVLKNAQKSGFFDRESIEVWDVQLVDLGKLIYQTRVDFLKEFVPYFLEYYHFISDSKETVEVEYKSELHDNEFMDLLNQSRQKDSFLGYTSKGVHRDDLNFLLNGHPVKKYGSQGQQKSFLIALKLAQFDFMKSKVKNKPIVLLDDIFDKLDHSRVKKLMELVADHRFGQVFVTDTDEERIKKVFKDIDVSMKLFTVENGKVDEA